MAASQTLLSSHAALLVSPLTVRHDITFSLLAPPFCSSFSVTNGPPPLEAWQPFKDIGHRLAFPVISAVLGERAGAPNDQRAGENMGQACCKGGENCPAPVLGLKTTFRPQIYKETVLKCVLMGPECLIPRDLSPFAVTLSQSRSL